MTRWYRTPELLLGTRNYNESVDTFAAGLVALEVLAGAPLVPGDTEARQLDLLTRVLGGPEADDDSPNPRSLKDWEAGSATFTEMARRRHRRLLKAVLQQKPRLLANLALQLSPKDACLAPLLVETFIDLVARLVAWDPKKRLTAAEARTHVFFLETMSVEWV